MQITDPVTVLTDFVLAVASLYFAYQLFRIMGPENRVSAWLWCGAFLGSTIAALLGGIYHGFMLYIDARTLRVLWGAIVYIVGLSTGFMFGGVHAADIRKEDSTLKWMLSGIFLTAAGLLIQRTEFRSHMNFNHNDSYHVLQIAAFYMFYKGACTLRDRQAVSTR
jgi:FlaA1/EpsC-like NDP-sugar epimerase